MRQTFPIWMERQGDGSKQAFMIKMEGQEHERCMRGRRRERVIEFGASSTVACHGVSCHSS